MKFIIDLDGTLLNGDQSNLDSVEFMKYLNDRNYDYLVMTNSIKSPSLIQEKLKNVGIDIGIDKIMNPINAINCYLKTRGLSNVFVVGSQMEVDQLDAVINNENPEIVILLDFEKTNVNYSKLQEVFSLICKGIPVITASGSNYYLKNGQKVLDTGAFACLLETAGEITIPVFGKPSYEYFMSGLRLLNASSREVIVIGDDWKTDIKGAMEVGCKPALIKSGKYVEGDECYVPQAMCLESLMDVFKVDVRS
ncbi:MAG: HAD hydrolase-like protein [Bacillota bacterium]|nr:HAD hydrolase-like protein [Bacillota bacterium]